jgi:CheY-like chemotaxis protein
VAVEGRSAALLLADENATVQRLVALAVADTGLEVLLASDGEQAIDILTSRRPALALVSTSLPKRDGYDVAAYVHAHPALRGTPVLLLAGAFDTVDDIRLREAGAAGVLTKPLDPATIVRRVKDLAGVAALDSGAAPSRDTPAHAVAGVDAPSPAPPPTFPAEDDRAQARTPEAVRDAVASRLDTFEAAIDHLDAHLEGRRPTSARAAEEQTQEAFSQEAAREGGASVLHPDARAEHVPPADSPPEWVPTPEEMALARSIVTGAAAPPGPEPDASGAAMPRPNVSSTEECPAAAGVTPDGRPPSAAAPLAIEPVASVAPGDLFGALLAAEQGELSAAEGPHAPGPTLPVSPDLDVLVERVCAAMTDRLSDVVAQRLADRVADQIVDRVLDRLRGEVGERLLARDVRPIVREVSERLVREEIARLRARR